MRISRADPDDPTKRRHFEVSIDSPFTVLNCRATQANTSLPVYTRPDSCFGQSRSMSCGCPDAAELGVPSLSPSSSTPTLQPMNYPEDNLPAPPQAAHLAARLAPALPQTPPGGLDHPVQSSDPADAVHPRPIHLMRVPSYNPPAFDAEEPPPPAEAVPRSALMTPPPQYDVIVGTPSVDGMADYFTRLADYNLEPEDSDSEAEEGEPVRASTRTGRVNVPHPRTPGGRRGTASRSMDIQRELAGLNLTLPGLNGSTETLNARVANSTAEATVV